MTSLAVILGAVGALVLLVSGWLLERRRRPAPTTPKPLPGGLDEPTNPDPPPPIEFRDPPPTPRPSRNAVDDHLRLIHSQRTGEGPVPGEGDP